jgi:hypothetical protein
VEICGVAGEVTVEIPRFGFALCLPLRIGYVVDPRTFTGFDFRFPGLFLGKHLLHIFACGGANSWFMSGLRKRRSRKDAVFSFQRNRVSYQGSGAVLPLDYFHCAPSEGNYLQRTGHPGGRRLRGMGFMDFQVREATMVRA